MFRSHVQHTDGLSNQPVVEERRKVTPTTSTGLVQKIPLQSIAFSEAGIIVDRSVNSQDCPLSFANQSIRLSIAYWRN
jgi:hypothetical protein